MNIGDKYNMLECVKYTKTEKYGKNFYSNVIVGTREKLLVHM